MGRRSLKSDIVALRALIEAGRYVIRPKQIAEAMLRTDYDFAESCSLALRSRSHIVRTKTR